MGVRLGFFFLFIYLFNFVDGLTSFVSWVGEFGIAILYIYLFLLMGRFCFVSCKENWKEKKVGEFGIVIFIIYLFC